MDMRIVAIETSGREGSVAVAAGGLLLRERTLPATVRHASEMAPAVQELVRWENWAPREIEQVYVSLGPGSFTGLRVATAFARALSQAVGCKLVGVPSLDVIAQNAPHEFGVVVPVLDAKRGQVFAAQFERNAAGELERTVEAGLVDPAEFVRAAAERGRELGGKVAVLGEGVEYHRAALLAGAAMGGGDVAELEKNLWHGRAAVVHRLGYAMAMRGEFTEPVTLLPIYVRLPEAEEVWRRKAQAAALKAQDGK